VLAVAATGLTGGAAGTAGAAAGAGAGRGAARACSGFGFGFGFGCSFGAVTRTSGSWFCAAAPAAKQSVAASAEPQSAQQRETRKVNTDIEIHS
jgi:hypothetical protein